MYERNAMLMTGKDYLEASATAVASMSAAS